MMYDIKPNRLRTPAENRAIVEQNNQDLMVNAAAEKAWANKENDIIGAKDAPKLTQNSNKGYHQTPAQRARQNISDNIAKKAGVEEDVFDKIARDHLEEVRKELDSESERWSNFGEEILNALNEGNERFNSRQTQGKIAVPQKGYGSRVNWYAETPEEYLDRYNAAEDYVMSDGENVYQNAAKGTFNRLRSAPGEAVEDLAYFLNDNAPWYKPAQKVIDKNVAGNIGKTATEQFGLAKEETGYLGDRLLDAADSASSMLGYAALFGPANLALSQGIGGGLDEYRYRRENGADKSEALARGLGTGLLSYGIERIGGLGAKISTRPKIELKKSNILPVVNSIVQMALQEGGEEAAEYTANSFMNSLADAIYKGEVSIDWNAEDAFNSAVTGAIAGGSVGKIKGFDGRYIDIVDKMNRIILDETDVDKRVNKALELRNSLGTDFRGKKEIDDFVYYLKEPKAKEIKGVTKNAWGQPITKVKGITINGAPGSITQREGKKGGIVRNYYGLTGDQYKQIANFVDDGDNNKKSKSSSLIEHRHQYKKGENEIPKHLEKEPLRFYERWENADIL